MMTPLSGRDEAYIGFISGHVKNNFTYNDVTMGETYPDPHPEEPPPYPPPLAGEGRGGGRLEGRPQAPNPPPSFETHCDRQLAIAMLLRMRSECSHELCAWHGAAWCSWRGRDPWDRAHSPSKTGVTALMAHPTKARGLPAPPTARAMPHRRRSPACRRWRAS